MKGNQDLMDKAEDLVHHLRQVDPVTFKDRRAARNLMIALHSFKEAEEDYKPANNARRGREAIKAAE